MWPPGTAAPSQVTFPSRLRSPFNLSQGQACQTINRTTPSASRAKGSFRSIYRLTGTGGCQSHPKSGNIYSASGMRTKAGVLSSSRTMSHCPPSADPWGAELLNSVPTFHSDTKYLIFYKVRKAKASSSLPPFRLFPSLPLGPLSPQLTVGPHASLVTSPRI